MATKKNATKPGKSEGIIRRFDFNEHRLFLLILLAGVILRVWQITWGLPHIYEEAIPLHYGMKFWDLAKSPIDRFFFVYPALTYYLQFAAQSILFGLGYVSGQYQNVAGFLAAFDADPTAFVVLGRLISVAFDAGTILVAYLLLCRIATKRTALFAAALVACNPLHISQAHLINVDTPLTFISLLLVYFLYALFERPERMWYILAGLMVGLAAATKYNAAILIVALVVVHSMRANSLSGMLRGLADKSLLAGIATSGVVFVILNPLIFTHFNDFLFKFQSTEQHLEVGHLGIDTGSSSMWFYFSQSLPSNLGWILTIGSLAAAASLLFSKKRKDYTLLVIPTLYLLLLASWKMRADRYILPVVPFLIIIASIGLIRLWDYLAQRFPRFLKSDRSQQYALAVLFLVAGFSSLGSVASYHRTIGLPDTRTVATAWIEQNLPVGAAIAAGPFGIELSDKRYLAMPIQFNAVNSEEMAPFYDTRWYEDLDLLVASDFDYGRYLQDPKRYGGMLAFYDSLRASWKMSTEYSPGDAYTGPTIWLYTFPRSQSSRVFEPALFAPLDASSLENGRKVRFLGKLGLILMVKQKPQKSEQCFRKLLEIDPENAIAKNALAQLAVLSQGHEDSAFRGKDSAPSAPGGIQSLEESAARLAEEGKLAEAETAYKAILRKDKNSHAAYQGLMMIYAYQDDRAKVIEILTRYLEILPPGNNEHKLIKQKIDALRTGK